jgi:hypothetical protein
VFSSFLSTEYQGSKEIFELIARRIFSILQKKKVYDEHYSSDTTLMIPKFNKSKLELRYYDYLTDVALRKGITTPELLVAFSLEQLSRTGADDDEDVADDSAEPNHTYEDFGTSI